MPEDVKQERYERVMALSARISAEKLAAKVGTTIDVIIDAVDPETGGATGRSKADAPEIDGEVHLRDAGGAWPGRHRSRSASRIPTSTTCSACRWTSSVFRRSRQLAATERPFIDFSQCGAFFASAGIEGQFLEADHGGRR